MKQPDENLIVDFYNRKWTIEDRRHVELCEDEIARMVAIRSALEAHKPTGLVDVLDYGCGTAWLAAYLPRRFRITGVDISDQAISAATRMFPEHRFVCASVFDDVLSGEQFDAVVSQEVIEHLPTERQEEYIARCRSYLRANGCLVLTTPNKWALINMRRYLGLSLEHLGEQPVENPLTIRQLRRMAEKYFRITRLYTVYDPIAHSGLHRVLYSVKLRRFVPGWCYLPHLLNAKLRIVLIANKRS